MSTNYEKLAEVLKHENDVFKHENKQLEEKYQNSCRKWRTAFDTMHRRAMTAEKESTRVKELMASQAESTPALTYGTDVDNGLVEFFINGKLLTEWTFEDDPELSFYEFKKVYEAGWENAVNQVKQLEFSHGLIKICLDEKSRLLESCEEALKSLDAAAPRIRAEAIREEVSADDIRVAWGSSGSGNWHSFMVRNFSVFKKEES